MISVFANARGDGSEILDELKKHPGWKVEAVFPLGHVFYSDDHRNYFVLLRQE
jgi:hypothetical protein